LRRRQREREVRRGFTEPLVQVRVELVNEDAARPTMLDGFADVKTRASGRPSLGRAGRNYVSREFVHQAGAQFRGPARHFLAEYLPKIVDKLTPAGKVDPTADHKQGLADLLPSLLQSLKGGQASSGQSPQA